MRYYQICFRGNSEDIKNDEEIERIIGRGYGTVLLRMNDYLWKNTKNGIEFLFYHEEADLLKAIFTYDEQRYSFVTVYDFITEQLKVNFKIRRMIGDCSEITMITFLEKLIEGERREHISPSNRIKSGARLWYYYYYINNDTEKQLPYKYSEKIIDKTINYIEIGSLNDTKASGLLQLGKLLNIPSEQILVFGDGDNDIEMFTTFENSVCMANGTNKVKTLSRYITKNNNNNSGVAEGINYYITGGVKK